MEQQEQTFQVLSDTLDECGLDGCAGKLQKIMDMAPRTDDAHRVMVEMRCVDCGARQPERNRA
jgi:hypothetical protein